MMKRSIFLAAVLAPLTIFGCDCGLEPAVALAALDPAVLDLGPVPEGEVCTVNVALRNEGQTNIVTNGNNIDNPNFRVLLVPGSVNLGNQEDLSIEYTSTGPLGERQVGNLTVETNAEPNGGTLTSTLTALPVEAAAAVAVSRCDDGAGGDEQTPCPEVSYGNVQIDDAVVPVGERVGRVVQIQIVNDGNAPMEVTTALIDGGADAFAVTGASLVGGTLEDFPVTVAPGRPEPCQPPAPNLCTNRDTCNVLTLDVKFGPAALGASAGELVVITDAIEGAEVRVPLTGVGSDVGISLAPDAVNFGDLGEGETATIDITVANIGSNDAAVNNSCIDLGGDGTCDGECTGGDPALDGALDCDVFLADGVGNEGKGFVLGPTDAVAGGTDERIIKVTWSPVAGNAAIPPGTVLRLESAILGNAIFDAPIVGGSIGELVADADPADVCTPNTICIQSAGDPNDTTTWTGSVAFSIVNQGDASLSVSGLEWDAGETVADDFGVEDDAANTIDFSNPGITLAPSASFDLVVTYANNDASTVDLPNLVFLHDGLGGELTVPLAVIAPE